MFPLACLLLFLPAPRAFADVFTVLELGIVVTVPLFALMMYGSIVSAEEHFVRAKFGPAFTEYCARVPRWLPRWRALPGALADATFHWRRVVKEYGTPHRWIITLCLVYWIQLRHVGE